MTEFQKAIDAAKRAGSISGAHKAHGIALDYAKTAKTNDEKLIALNLALEIVDLCHHGLGT